MRNPTIHSGKPRQVGPGAKQLDGSRTATFSAPKKHPGLAPREAVPNRPTDSGMERAMQDHADQIHKC
jgi:hypothetical protein